MSMMMLNGSTQQLNPSGIATLLKAFLDFPNFELRVMLGCENKGQSGQVRRRIKEALREMKIDPDQHFTFSEDSTTIQIRLPKSEQEEGEETEVQEAEVPIDLSKIRRYPRLPEEVQVHTPVAPTGQTPARPSPTGGNGQVLEGDFKVIARRCDKLEIGDRYFVQITWEITEGSHQGKKFQDKVMVWPVDVRAQHFARALSVKAEELGEKLDSLVGAKAWDRRREVIREDGTAKIVNHYYPPDWTPPPKWSKGA